jgi:hypothetical protein
MPMSRLELVSAHGDQTLANIRFVIYRPAAVADTPRVFTEGVTFVEGRPVVSTTIVRPQNAAGEVIICAVPANFHLGYGVFTTAYIDRVLKKVTGAPMHYAAGRNQLALYMEPDAEAARVHIESEIANGFAMEQRPHFILEPKFLIGRFSGPGFEQITRNIEVSVESFEPVDYSSTEEALRELFQPSIPANMVLAPTAMRDVLIGTVESLVMTRLRLMRWRGLAMLGYSFSEGRQPVTVEPVRDATEQRRLIDEVGRRLASSALFSAELAWLKVYATHLLDLMRVELEAAELNSAEAG